MFLPTKPFGDAKISNQKRESWGDWVSTELRSIHFVSAGLSGLLGVSTQANNCMPTGVNERKPDTLKNNSRKNLIKAYPQACPNGHCWTRSRRSVAQRLRGCADHPITASRFVHDFILLPVNGSRQLLSCATFSVSSSCRR